MLNMLSMLTTSSFADLKLHTPPPCSPTPREENSGSLATPAARASVNLEDDLEPYNLPFTD